MEVITRDTEEVRAYFEALEEGMRYLDTVTAHFRPAMNGEVYLTGEDVCRLLHITPRTLQDYRTQRLIPYISLPGKTLYRQSDLLRMLEENYVDMRPKRKRGKSPTYTHGGVHREMQQRQGHRIGSSCLCRILRRGRRQAVSRRERRTRFPSCFLSFFSSTLRCMAARLPEIARKSELTILLVTSA